MGEYPRGSEWRRWDLHIHTPKSILNNQFGDDFDAYVVELIRRSQENNIAVIGITDYFTIDGYSKLMSEYKSNEQKLTELFTIEGSIDARLIDKFNNTLLLPNIEFRLDTITEKDDSLNFHIILSNELSLEEIQSDFIEKITFNFGSEEGSQDIQKTLTQRNIELFGQKLKKENSTFTGTDYYIGLKHLTVNENQILQILNSNPIFRDKFIAVLPCDKELTSLPWGSRSHSIRRNLIAKSHMMFTSNANNINWSLGKKYENVNDFVEEFKSIKACIHGSDAHEIVKLFRPDENRYCWIKADPTFEGLKQVIFEPEQRVKISEIKPEEKQGYQVIDRVEFIDGDFQIEPIYFNENLNCIIGGKSTGKSILIQNLARHIDESQTTKHLGTSKRCTKNDVRMNVYWKDGSSDSHKIVYIPQTYLNQLSDAKENQTEIDKWVEDIILKNHKINSEKQKFLMILKEYKNSVSKILLDFISADNELKKIYSEKSDIGNKEGIIIEIEKLTKEKEQLVATSGLSEEDVLSYDESKSKVAELSKKVDVLQLDKANLEAIDNIVSEIELACSFSEYSSELVETHRSLIIDNTKSMWEKAKKEILTEISNSLDLLNEGCKPYFKIIKTLKEKIESNEAVKLLTQKISNETDKLTKISELEGIESRIEDKRNYLLEKLSESGQKYKHIHELYAVIVNNNTIESDGLLFQAETPFRRESFLETLAKVYHTSRTEFKMLVNIDSFSESEYTIELLNKIINSTINNELVLKKGYSPETALREVLDNWFNIVYRVKMDNDLIEHMSPGKKALVLLKILISLAESRCPILIDQPEDDLDNRSIYTELINFIKVKKIDRQIIVVTHNANIVLGSDAENVIIANQAGKDAPNKLKRFEYRSGSIENNAVVYKSDGETIEDGVLYQHGIQQHICDVLEGGEAAFEIRKKKYRI